MGVATGTAYHFVHENARRSSVQFLNDYVKERAKAQRIDLHRVEHSLEFAREMFLKRDRREPFEGVDQLWLERNQLHADGAWRTRRDNFDPQLHSSTWVRRDTELSPALKRRLLGTELMLNDFLPGLMHEFPSLYFVFNDQACVGYDARFPTWVWDTSATYDNCAERAYVDAAPAKNPGRELVWGPAMREPTAKRPFMSVTLPIWKDEEFLGIVGHDIPLEEFHAAIAEPGLRGVKTMIVRNDGTLIAHPEMEGFISEARGTLSVQSLGDPQLSAIYETAIATTKAGHLVCGITPCGAAQFATIRWDNPDWIFIGRMTLETLRAEAFGSARWVLWYGLASLTLMVALFAWILRREILDPLSRLAATADQITARQSDFGLAARKDDELGKLISALRQAAEKIWDRQSAMEHQAAFLEQRVAERTTELARYAALVDASQDLYGFSDLTVKLLYLNPAGRQMLGLGREESLCGLSVWDLYPAEEKGSAVEPMMAKALREGSCYGESKLRRHDGSVTPVSLMMVAPRSSRGEHGIVAIVMRDISERIQLETDRAARFRMMSLSAEMGLVLNKQAELQKMLQQCTEVLVRHLDAALARIWTLEPEQDVLLLQASAGLYTHLDRPDGRIKVGDFRIGLIAREQRPHLTNQVLDDPGVADKDWAREHRMKAFAGYPLVLQGKLLGVVAIFSRRTLGGETLQALGMVANSIALGIERKTSEAALQTALQKERELGRLKTNFVAMVSHELRTPLEVIISSTDILDRYNDRLGVMDRDEHINAIRRSVNRMSSMMEDVLLLGRLENSRVQLRIDDVDLALCCQRVASEVSLAMSGKCPILLQLQDDLPLAKADENLFRHILTNLLSNAAKYSTVGSPLKVTLSRNGEDAVIVVADSGMGIPKPDLDHLFEAFYRGSNAANIAGTGLGLVIIRRCVDLHRGTITVVSEEGKGTIFTVRSPILGESMPMEILT